MTDETKPAERDLDLDAMGDRLERAFFELSTLAESSPPSVVIGLAATVVGGVMAIFIDMAKSARRTAVAQETLVAIAQADLEQLIQEQIENGVDKAVEQRMSKRSFIGKPPSES